MRRVVGWIVVGAILASGCGPSSDRSPTTATTSGEATRGSISFLAMQYSTATLPYWEKVAAAFERENPGVKINLQVVRWDQGQTKLKTLIGAKNPPDLANIATTWLTEYADAGLLEPLDSRMTTEFASRFVPITLQGATFNEKTYGLPVAVSVRALYYNKGLLAKAKKQPPRTWAELREVAKATHSRNAYGFAIPCDSEEGHAYFAYFLWGAGGDFCLAKTHIEGLRSSPMARDALRFLVDLVRTDKCTNPSPSTTNRDRDCQEWFKQGRAAMLITGSWFWKMLDSSSKVDYGIVPIPTPKAPRLSSAMASAGTMAVTDNLVMFNSCRQKDAAWRFLDFIYQHQRRKEFDDGEGMLPELKSVTEEYRKNPKWRLFIEQLPNGKFLPNHPRSQQIFQEIIKAQQRAYLGEVDPARALIDASKRINNDILKR